MSVQIIDRGRGPEIAGTRITVYTILEYLQAGHHHTYIASMLGISSPEVIAAQEYIEAHKDEVLADYEKIMEPIRRGNPPEIEAKLQESRAKLAALRERLRQAKPNEKAHEGDLVGQ